MKKTALIVMMLAILCQPVLAATDYNVCFNSLDSDYDGSMSTSEFAAGFPDGDEKVFAAADANKDGGVDHEEWEEYKESLGFEEKEH